MSSRVLFLMLAVFLCSCSGINPGYQHGEFDMKKVSEEPLSPTETRAMMGDLGESWLYGSGVGETAIAVGSVVLFPPMALVYAGNSALSMFGEEPVTLWRFMPDEQAQSARDAYSTFVSTPGRVSAVVAGEQFHDQQRIRERLDPYVDRYRVRITPQEYLSMGNRE